LSYPFETEENMINGCSKLRKTIINSLALISNQVSCEVVFKIENVSVLFQKIVKLAVKMENDERKEV